MTPKRVLCHLAILGYLLFTFAGFTLTMTKLLIPLPYFFVQWSYGMMAPYQGDTPWNGDLVVEGQLPDGTTQIVSLDPYMPYLFGEANARRFLRIYRPLGWEVQRWKFTEFGLMLLDRERAAGRPYTVLHLYFDRWPRSNGGFEFLHQPLFTEREFITDVR